MRTSRTMVTPLRSIGHPGPMPFGSSDVEAPWWSGGGCGPMSCIVG